MMTHSTLVEAALAEMSRARPTGATGLALALLDAATTLWGAPPRSSNASVIRQLCQAAVEWRPNRGALLFTATALCQLVDDCRIEIGPLELESFTTGVREFLHSRQSESARAVAAALADARTVMTVCSSTTAIEGLRMASQEGKLERAIVLETRPDFDGLITAARLAASGVEVKVVVDGAAASVIDQVQAVLVGADVVTSDAWLLNRIGTATIAEVALARGVPFFSAAPTYVLGTAPHRDIVIRTRDIGPMMLPYQLRAAPAFTLENLPEDLTPPSRVRAYLSSGRALPPDEYAAVARADLADGVERLVRLASS